MSKQPIFNRRVTDPRLENLLGRSPRASREEHGGESSKASPVGQLDPFSGRLIGMLQHCATFEEAAGVLLRTSLAMAAEGLKQVSSPHDVRLLRAMVHLRPAGGYRGLMVLQFGQEEATALDREELMPSTTVWRLVEQYNTSVSLDVHLGEAQPAGQPRVSLGSLVREVRPLPQALPVESSRLRLLQRDTTHLLAIPMRVVHNEVVGMVSLEAHSESHLGGEFPWHLVSEQLELLAQLASPYLSLRPSRPRSSTLADQLLPVVGESMVPTFSLLKCFAMQEETVLLLGPTGSGKSRIAEWVHRHSKRADKPFVRASLSNDPEQLQQSRLFGHIKGAFTGAVAHSCGLLEEAEGGTLFLDEIDKLSRHAQVSLLGLLENRTYRPLGSSREKRADVRFLVATNRDLRAMVEEGTFLLDLYFRINVLPIHLPQLRARSDELVGWAEYFLTSFRRANGIGSGAVRLAPEAVQALHDHDWPGNLRELDNVLRRAYIMGMMSASSEEDFLLDGATLRWACLLGNNGINPTLPNTYHPLLARMVLLAREYVEEARRSRTNGSLLGLELAEQFPGLVMAAAADAMRGRKAAFSLFGLEKQLENRNDARIFERMVSGFVNALQKHQLPMSDELKRLLLPGD